jgi:hypothetical protein
MINLDVLTLDLEKQICFVYLIQTLIYLILVLLLLSGKKTSWKIKTRTLTLLI